MKRFLTSLSLAVASLSPAYAQTDLDSLQVITSTEVTPQITEQTMFWLEVSQSGLYRFTLDKPGIINLYAFPTDDGRFDGNHEPDLLLSDGGRYRAGALSNVLLPAGSRYLLLAKPADHASLSVSLTENLGAASTPLDGQELPQGSDWQVLYQLRGDIDLKLAPFGSDPLKLEVIGEPRADTYAKVEYSRIHAGGTYPLLLPEASELELDADVDTGPAPYVLVRMVPDTSGLDEREPNSDYEYSPARPYVLGTDFNGAFLAVRDADSLVFSTKEQETVALEIHTDAGWLEYTATLEKQIEDDWITLAERIALQGLVSFPQLVLNAGEYRLTVAHDEDAATEPVPYTVSSKSAPAPMPGFEQEPNDTFAAAFTLPQNRALRGALAEKNPDFIAFDIPEDGHLWRLFAVRGVNRLILTDTKGGGIADIRGDTGRLMLDSLALVYGRYVVELRGEGKYALKLMDLGPIPDGYETEPNDRHDSGLRMGFDKTYNGSFLNSDDADYFVFRLDAATPVEIALTAPDDGALRAELSQDGARWDSQAIVAAGETYIYAANLSAGDYALYLRGAYKDTRGTYAVSVNRVAHVATNEPDTLPENLRAMPLSGNIQGNVGMLDGYDLVHTTLPEGSGKFMIGCKTQPDLTWRVLQYTDGESLAYGRSAPEIIAYSAETGGAVQLKIQGENNLDQTYECALRFAPQQALDTVMTATETEAPFAVKPGTRVTGWLADARDRDAFSVTYPDGMAGGYVCRDANGVLLSQYDGIEYVSGFDMADDPFDNGVRVFRGKPDKNPGLRLNGTSDLDLPFAYTCDFYTLDDMPTLKDMGPLAPFTALEIQAAENSSAPPVALPPILQPGRPAWIPEAATTGPLPLIFALAGFDAPLATYSRSGQQVDVVVTITNTGDTEITGAITPRMLAEGWRIRNAPENVTLAAGETLEIPLTLQAPPMLSPSLDPALAITLGNGIEAAGATFDVPLALDVAAQNPFSYWSAPEQMLGGVNVLNYHLGTRISRWNGEELDESDAEYYQYLHDGLAMHSSTRAIDAKVLVFTLAQTAPIAGAMFQLRSTEPRAEWPAGYEIALSEDGVNWRVAAEGTLSATSQPQYVPFARTSPAQYMRLRLSGCQGDPECSRISLSEIALIAGPGWKPSKPLNIVRPDLGGHVVYATSGFGGSWNSNLLAPDGRNASFREIDERWADIVDVVIAFEQNRAANIARIVWNNTENVEDSFPYAEVYAATSGPDGPWQHVGRLPAPSGAQQAELALSTPAWARYVKLSFPRHAENYSYGPGQIAIFEHPDALPVTGLWEDDSARGPYEYTQNIPPRAAPDPVGGATRDTARELATGVDIASSVLIERNEDWWKITVPEGLPQELTLDFGQNSGRAEYVWEVQDSAGKPVPFKNDPEGRENVFKAVLGAGFHTLDIHEPPRSVVITWDTSGSVGAYIPKTLEAVRIWAKSLQTGRDSLQLLPFGEDSLLMPDWAGTPGDVVPYLAALPESGSSDSETAMRIASKELRDREGARGIVIITDAENSMVPEMWPEALSAMPRVVALSIDSTDRQNTTVMMDWANINGGIFHRVVGVMGLADGLDMAAALFRAPKPYTLRASMTEVQEPEGEATLTISALLPDPENPVATGGIEVILDASGSMLKRMDNGERRIKVAHAALSALVRDSLPEGTPFAFRAFGLEKDACLSELVVPLGPLDRAAAIQAINDVPAINLAKTAIAKSLLATREDLADATEPRVVVLVTDGEETCDGDVGQAIEALRSGGFDVRVNIVGFAIDDAELAETFALWAEQGGGAYFEAREADALSAAVAKAIQPRFTVTLEHYDGTEETLMTIGAGETVSVPAGRLRIEPATAAVGEPVRVEARDTDEIAVDYDPANGLEAPQ